MKAFLIMLGQLVFALLMYCMGTVFFGLALMPGIALVCKAWAAGQGIEAWGRYMLLGVSIAGGYFLFGFSLILLVGLVRTLLRLRLKEGAHHIFSFQALKWAFVSSLYLLIGTQNSSVFKPRMNAFRLPRRAQEKSILLGAYLASRGYLGNSGL